MPDAMQADVTKRPDFQIITRALTVYKSAEGKPMLRGVGSSNIIDLGGDRMERSALDDMVKAIAGQGFTIFLNHSYNVPEDVFGSCRKGELTPATDVPGGQVYDLTIDIAVDDTSERAMKTYKSIENGTKLGISIGTLIDEYDYVPAKDGAQGYTSIKRVSPLEWSIVGIPANQRSWVQQALKALKARPDWKGKAAEAQAAADPAAPDPAPPADNPARRKHLAGDLHEYVERVHDISANLAGMTCGGGGAMYDYYQLVPDALKHVTDEMRPHLEAIHDHAACMLGWDCESGSMKSVSLTELSTALADLGAVKGEIATLTQTIDTLKEQMQAAAAVYGDAKQAAATLQAEQDAAQKNLDALKRKAEELAQSSAGRPTRRGFLNADGTLTDEALLHMTPDEAIAALAASRGQQPA